MSRTNCFYKPPVVEKRDTTKIRFRRGCGYSTFYDQPLYIIDGEVVSNEELRKIDPDVIESVSVLKGVYAPALYGSRGMNGVVVFTTKKISEIIIEVRDNKTGESLPFTTIEITRIGKWRTDRYTTDSLGQVKVKMVTDNGYGLIVNHVGYNDSKVLINRRKKEKQRVIYLERIQAETKIKVYPNPADRSSNITLEFESKNESKIKLNLLSINSNLISSKEFQLKTGINRLTHFTNAGLASGIYIIQLLDENNKLIKSEKLIIQ